VTLSLWRQALKALLRSPGYAIPVAISIAMGVGLNTAVFVFIDGVIRRPLPFRDEASIVTVARIPRGAGVAQQATPLSWDATTAEDLRSISTGSRSLSQAALLRETFRVVEGEAGAEYVRGAMASPALGRVLGVSPIRGRWFDEAETRDPVIVIGYSLWRRQFAMTPSIIGKKLQVQGTPFTVIGVMASEAVLPFGAEFWVPILGPGQLVARVRSGVNVSLVAAELEGISPSVAYSRARGDTVTLLVAPLREQLFGNVRPALRLVATGAGLMLLIACANIASLSLARALERKRELALRVTLGSSRASLGMLILGENLVLAVLGVMTGLIIAGWTIALMTSVAPPEIGRVPIDFAGGALVFASVVGLLVAVVVSLAPLASVSGRSLQPMLAQASGASSGTSPGLQRLRHALVVAQMALAVLLLSAVGMLTRSVGRLVRPDHLGFQARGIVVASVRLLGPEYRSPEGKLAFIRLFALRAAALPGVQSTAVGPPPLVGGRGETMREGFSAVAVYADSNRGVAPATVWIKHVDEGYFDTFGIPLRSGRGFRSADGPLDVPVAVVNAAAAKLMFPGKAVIGQSLPDLGLTTRATPTVVGTVADVLQRDVAVRASPEVYVPLAQQTNVTPMPTLAVRAENPAAVIQDLRHTLRSIDPSVAAIRLESMSEIIETSLRRHGFLLFLLRLYAGLGFTLAIVGLYAVISYLVTNRASEISLRMALGAQTHQVVKLIVGECALLIASAVAIGVPAAVLFGRSLRAYMFEVSAADPYSLMLATLALAAAGMTASYFPARRAASADPVSALRAL
jgi:putative ABC transport system permease protein